MKQSYYFSHDYNARNDPKLQKVLMSVGQEGKGVFWDLVELLYEQNGYLNLSDIESYAYVLRTTSEIIENLIKNFGLFKNDEKKFWSDSVLVRLKKRKNKTAKAKKAAKARWQRITEESKGNADALQTHSESNAIKGKEIKGKESKVKESNTEHTPGISESNLFRKPEIPTLETVQRIFIQQGGTGEMAQKFYESNEATGWFFKGSPITNFATMIPGYIAAWKKNINGKNYSKASETETPMRTIQEILYERDNPKR